MPCTCIYCHAEIDVLKKPFVFACDPCAERQWPSVGDAPEPDTKRRKS